MAVISSIVNAAAAHQAHAGSKDWRTAGNRGARGGCRLGIQVLEEQDEGGKSKGKEKDTTREERAREGEGSNLNNEGRVNDRPNFITLRDDRLNWASYQVMFLGLKIGLLLDHHLKQ